MNLNNLHSFYETVKCNSISGAAKKLHLTQPGLSRQLQGLENELEVKLLNRTNKGVELTESGKIVYEYASTLLTLESNMRKDIQKLTDNKRELSISCCKNLGEYILPCSIYTFKEIYFNIKVNMEVHNSVEVLNQVTNFMTNLGVVQGVDIPDELNSIPILVDELILIGGPNVQNQLTLNELLELPLILREQDSGTRFLLMQVLKKQAINHEDFNVRLTLNSPESIKSAVKANHGFSFLPRKVVLNELKNGTLTEIPIENVRIPFKYHLIYRKNHNLSECEQLLVNFLTSDGNCFCC